MCVERAARSHTATDRKSVMFTVDISSSADRDCPPGRIGPSNQIWYLKPQAVFVAQDAAGWMLREREEEAEMPVTLVHPDMVRR